MANAQKPAIRIISPNYRAKAGIFEALANYAKEIRKDRWQIWMNFLRKFRSSYSTTFFGMFWAFALPLVPIGAYTLLATLKVVSQAEEMPFIVYIALGVTLYAYITAPISETMSALKGEMSLLSKTHIGAFSVILGRFGTIAFETLVRFVAIGVLMWAFGGYPTSWQCLYALPIALMAFLSAIGVGMILAVANAVAADVEKVVSVILRFGVFFSAVFFPMPSEGRMAAIIQFNPLHTFIESTRRALVLGDIGDPKILLWTCGVGALLFLFGILLFYKSELHLRASG